MCAGSHMLPCVLAVTWCHVCWQLRDTMCAGSYMTPSVLVVTWHHVCWQLRDTTCAGSYVMPRVLAVMWHHVCWQLHDATCAGSYVTPRVLAVRWRHVCWQLRDATCAGSYVTPLDVNSCFPMQNKIVSSSTLKDVGVRILWHFGTFHQTTWYHITVDCHLGTTIRNSNLTHNWMPSGISLNIHQIVINNIF
jgi:hypothetical protein